MELDSYNSWNSPENQELLRKFVEQGGTLVILDRGYPIMRDDPAGFSNFSDLFGFSTFDSVVTAPPLVRATEEGAEIFSDPA